MYVFLLWLDFPFMFFLLGKHCINLTVAKGGFLYVFLRNVDFLFMFFLGEHKLLILQLQVADLFLSLTIF